MKTSSYAIAVTLLSAIAFSAKAIFAKLAYRFGVDPISLLTMRMVLAAPFFAIPIFFHPPTARRKIAIHDHWFIWCVGILGFYFSAVLDFVGLTYVSAGLERTILYSYPTIVAIIGYVWFKDKLTRTHILALIVTYSGLLISLRAEVADVSSRNMFGALLIFLCALTYAFYMMASKPLVDRYGTLRFTCYAILAATLAVTVHSMLFVPPQTFIQPSSVYWIALGMAIFSTVLPTIALSFGIGRLGAAKASLISSIGPVATIALGMVFLGEFPGLDQCFGVALVIVGVLIVCTRDIKETRGINANYKGPMLPAE